LKVEKLFFIPALRIFFVVVLPLLPVMPIIGPLNFFKADFAKVIKALSGLLTARVFALNLSKGEFC